MGRQTEFVFLALVICALMLSSSLQPRGSPNRPVAVTPSAQLQPPEPVQPPRMSTGRQPGSGGSGDATSSHSVAAGGQQKRLRVRLIMLVVNIFPVWWPFLVASYRLNHPSIELLVIHANVSRPEPGPGTEHVKYAQRSVPELVELFARKLSVAPDRVSAKFDSVKGLSDLKPFYGRAFEEWLPEPSADGRSGWTHWGWVDWDLMLGDVLRLCPPALLWEYDAVTFPGATLGYAWAGQLTIFQNTEETRGLYTVVDNHLARGFKSHGDAQSGWEERDFLRDTLRRRPQLSILFHMAAQMDHKAQWLTWIPFDNYWDNGKIWRCTQLDGPAAAAAVRARRPPLLPLPRWRRDVQAIKTDPQAYYSSNAVDKDRVCLRWDLESSPWKCCPHSIGVSYGWRDGVLSAIDSPHPNGSAALLARLAAARRTAGAPARLPSYDVCHEGAAFHAGLVPLGARAPRCPHRGGTWALIDDIGRFTGQLRPLDAADAPC